MLKSNSKKAVMAIRQHIIDSVIDSMEEAGVVGLCEPSFQDAQDFIWDDFCSRANYENNIRRFPHLFDRWLDFMRGLPFHFDVYFDEQRESIASWLEETEEEKNRYNNTKVEDMYFRLIYRELIKGQDLYELNR